MFQAVGSLDLDCINKQQPLRRYESEEEDVSESEVGGQDHSFSPVDFHRSDSDLSADEMSNVDEPDNWPRLVSPCQPVDKDSRPVSMTTIKRASDATFVAGSYIYDAEDDMIIELPSPETPTQLPSSAFLQPTVYNPLESKRSSTCLSFRSPSPASCLSDDDTDVLVAEQVKYVEPVTKPNLIMISPTSTESSTDETPSAGSGKLCPSSTSSSIQKEQAGMVSSLRQPLTKNCTAPNKRNAFYDHSGDVQPAQKPNHSEPIYQGTSLGRMNTSATVNCLPVPTLPHPASRPQSISTPRPRTSISDKVANHVRLPSKLLRRPPSLRSMSSFSAPFWQRPFSPRFEDAHSRSMSYSRNVYSSDAMSSRSSRPYSGTPSHASPYSAFSRLRSESTYNLSNAACDIPLPIRHQTVKHSAASSVWSTNSFRSDGTSANSLDGSEPTDNSFKRKLGRTRTFRRTKQQQTESAEKPSGKSFLGLRLGGKRKSTVKDAHF